MRWTKQVERQQLDRRLDDIRRHGAAFSRPSGGWVAAIRSALGMTQRTLAERMRLSQQAISSLEQREADGTITLNALQDAARALGGDLVYAIVPRTSITDVLEQRAYRLARRMTSSVQHTMRIEDQETGSDDEARVRELANALLEQPGRLWSVPDERE